MSDEAVTCRTCGCADFLHVRSDVLPGRPVTLAQCEDCGTQYSTGVLTQLGGLPLIVLRGTSTEEAAP